MTKLFQVSKTYDIVTIESASRGDYAESGFVYESTSMTLRELVQELNSIGGLENFQANDISQSLYSIDPDIDYSTGDERNEAIHIKANPRVMKRFNRIFPKLFRLK